MAELKKITWAVDPVAEDMALQERCVHLLKSIAKKTSLAIEPVYVLSPDQLQLSSSFFPVKIGEFRLEAEQRLSKYLKRVKIPGIQTATVLVSSDLSLRSAVHALIEHARSSASDLIVVSTLSRKGMTRFLLGSFAETLIMQSDIPVLLVSPKTKVAASIKEILVPTDFSDRSKEILPKVAMLARAKGAKVVLYNQMEYLTQYTMDQFGVIPSYQKYLAEDSERRKSLGEKWVNELKEEGVRAEFVLNQKGAFTSDAILASAKKRGSSLIAMASQTGPVASILLGSVTRQVIRGASCPVWVIHPEGYRQKEKTFEAPRFERATVIL